MVGHARARRSAMSCMPTQMPRNGPALAANRSVQRLDHAGQAVEARAAIGEGADARQHDALGRLDRRADRR